MWCKRCLVVMIGELWELTVKKTDSEDEQDGTRAEEDCEAEEEGREGGEHGGTPLNQ